MVVIVYITTTSEDALMCTQKMEVVGSSETSVTRTKLHGYVTTQLCNYIATKLHSYGTRQLRNPESHITVPVRSRHCCI